jgi:pimeloyl-ACP methyl ester carboxylesterase
MKSILLIPGYGGTVEPLRKDLRPLAEYYHVYAIEFVEHCCILVSVVFDKEIHYEYIAILDYHQWLEQALGNIEDQDVTLCACSLGAYLLLTYPRIHDISNHIVLICPFGLTRELGPIGKRLACMFKCIYSVCFANVFGTSEINQHIRCQGCCSAHWDDEPIWDVIKHRPILLFMEKTIR